MKKSLLGVVVCMVLLVPITLLGQQSESIQEHKRPKICLVLSGGGARGAAHIGVLKVLEEYKVPVDCIVGTSMGALVGGAYASGTSVQDMEKLVTSLSTNTLFRDNPPRDEMNIRRKEEDYTFLFSPEMGLNGSVLPRGVVSGVQLETVLRKIAAPGYRNFDHFPIPYRAVATDLTTGKMVVFDKGEIANAMRASMSVPVAIAPAVVNKKLLVDGMLTENLPVSVAQSMGADVIIAVNVGTPLLQKNQLGSITGVAGQMLSILTEQNVQKSLGLLKSNDILISPDLGDFATSDFDHLAQTLPIGEAAARVVKEKLLPLSLTAQEYAAYRAKLPVLVMQDTRLVDAIVFKDLKRVNPLYLESLMQTKVNLPLNQERLNQDLRQIYGTGDFEHIDYHIETNNDKHTLIIHAAEKPWGPDYVRFGMGFNTDFQGDSQFALQGRLKKTWMNSYGAEWLTDIQVGSINQIKTQWYQPIDVEQHYFVSPMVEFVQSDLRVFAQGDELALYDLDTLRGEIDVGYNIARYGQVSVGVTSGIVYGDLRTGDSSYELTNSSVKIGGLNARFLLDKLDSVAFPTDGWRLQGSLYSSHDWLGAEVNYLKGEILGDYIFTHNAHSLAISMMAKGGLDGELPTYDYYKWGGFLHQSGYQSEELLGKTLLFSRLIYTNKLIEYQAFDGLYVGGSFEVGKMDDPLVTINPTDTMVSGSLFLATDTPVGPLYLGYGQAKTGEGSLYFYLGIPY